MRCVFCKKVHKVQFLAAVEKNSNIERINNSQVTLSNKIGSLRHPLQQLLLAANRHPPPPPPSGPPLQIFSACLK